LLERTVTLSLNWKRSTKADLGAAGECELDRASTLADAVCGRTEKGCKKGECRSTEDSVMLMISVRLRIAMDASNVRRAARHEYHHAQQYKYEVQQELNKLQEKEWPCVPVSKIGEQKEMCEDELEENARNAFVAAVSGGPSYPYHENPVEFDGGPHGDHPLGGAHNHHDDDWPEGYTPPVGFQ
jgi:hypothetical protein